MHNSLDLLRQNIQRELERRGWTLKDLAKKAKISPPAMSVYLSGKKDPSLPTVDRIADALQVSAAELISEPPADLESRYPEYAKAPESTPAGNSIQELLLALASLDETQLNEALTYISALKSAQNRSGHLPARSQKKS